MTLTAAPTLSQALAAAASRLSQAGCDTPRLDAEVLLAHVLGTGRERLVLDREAMLEGPVARAFHEALARRALRREPVAYITGRRHFHEIELNVDARALIPRPETELLVEAGLGLGAGSAVLDLGTGSGALALALARQRADLEVWGSDISRDALELAMENGARLGVHVHWLSADLLDGVPAHIDTVLSNPPYVAEAERQQLAPELSHEPEGALFAGVDGLEVIERLLRQLSDRKQVRRIALEVGAKQASHVTEAIMRHGFGEVRVMRDLAGFERVICGSR